MGGGKRPVIAAPEAAGHPENPAAGQTNWEQLWPRRCARELQGGYISATVGWLWGQGTAFRRKIAAAP